MLGLAAYVRGRRGWERGVVKEKPELLRGGSVVDDDYGTTDLGRAVGGGWRIRPAHCLEGRWRVGWVKDRGCVIGEQVGILNDNVKAMYMYCASSPML